MVRYFGSIKGNFTELISQLQEILIRASSAKLVEQSRLELEGKRIRLMVFEKKAMPYSHSLTMTILLVENQGGAQIRVIVSGGQKGLLSRDKTRAEERFLKDLQPFIDKYT